MTDVIFTSVMKYVDYRHEYRMEIHDSLRTDGTRKDMSAEQLNDLISVSTIFTAMPPVGETLLPEFIKSSVTTPHPPTTGRAAARWGLLSRDGFFRAQSDA